MKKTKLTKLIMWIHTRKIYSLLFCDGISENYEPIKPQRHFWDGQDHGKVMY